MQRILLIEDDPSGRDIAVANLEEGGFVVDAAASGREGLALLDLAQHALVVADVRLPDTTGLDLVRQVRRMDAELPIIVITAYPSVDVAVSAMRAGAYDFITKPFGRERLLLTVRRALDFAALKEEAGALRVQASGIEHRLVYSSECMASLIEVADRAAQSSAPVFISGEPGVGKGVLARRIHVRSQRAQAAFASVRCSVTPADLLAREIFGDGTGAGRSAGKMAEVAAGTLFLDEVTALSLDDQRRLSLELDAQDRGQAARIVASSQFELEALEQADGVLDELIRRIGVVRLHVPALRKRRSDIGPLADFFVHRFSGGRQLTFEDGLLRELEKRPWAGNVRELRNVCERLVVLATGNQLRVADLPTLRSPDDQATPGWPELPPEGLSLIDLEKSVIERVLDMKSGNVTQAAVYLGVPRHFLAYRLQKYGIR